MKAYKLTLLSDTRQTCNNCDCHNIVLHLFGETTAEVFQYAMTKMLEYPECYFRSFEVDIDLTVDLMDFLQPKSSANA